MKGLFIYFTKVLEGKKKHFFKYVTGFQQASYAVKYKQVSKWTDSICSVIKTLLPSEHLSLCLLLQMFWRQLCFRPQINRHLHKTAYNLIRLSAFAAQFQLPKSYFSSRAKSILALHLFSSCEITHRAFTLVWEAEVFIHSPTLTSAVHLLLLTNYSKVF